MTPEEPVQAKVNDFEPLLPIDIIRSPQQRGNTDQPIVIPPLEPETMPEGEAEEKHKKEGEAEEKHKKEIPYKGDVNAPVDAEHPLANPPDKL
jgi:hypothetical protein